MGVRIAATREARTGCGRGARPRGRSGGNREVDVGDGEEAREPVNARSDGDIGRGAVRIPRGSIFRDRRRRCGHGARLWRAGMRREEACSQQAETRRTPGPEAGCNTPAGSRRRKPSRWWKTTRAERSRVGSPIRRGTGGDIGGMQWTPRLPNGGGAYFDNPRRGSPAWRTSDGKDRNVSGQPARNDHEGGTAKRSNFAPDPSDGPRSAGWTPRERQVAQAQGGQGGSQRFPTF